MDSELAPAPGSPWRIWHAAVVFVAAQVTSLIALIIAVAISGDTEVEKIGSVLAAIVGQWVGFAGGAILLSRKYGTGSLRRDFGLRFEFPSDLKWGILLGVAGQLIVILVSLPILELVPDADEEINEFSTGLVESAESLWIVPLFVVLALGTPIVEELFFRGLLLRALQGRFSTGWAVATASIVFGLAHAWQQLLGVPALTAFGVLLTLVVVRTGRLGRSIAAHATFNALTVTVLLSI